MSLKCTLSRALAFAFGLALCAAAIPPGSQSGGKHGGMIDPDGLHLAAWRGDHGGMIDPDGRA